MANSRRQLMVFLLLFLLVVSSTAVPTSRSINTDDSFHPQDVKEEGDIKMDEVVERRKDMELADYPGTGANNHHDPAPPRIRV